MNETSLLSWLIFSPFIGATALWFFKSLASIRQIALITSAITLIISLFLLGHFDNTNSSFQFIEKALWIPTLNIHYFIGIDGISILFLPLSCLLFAGVIIASWTSITNLPRLYYSLLLCLQGSILGIFCALDTILFFLFWEMTLIPLYFLISLWGVGPNRRYAAVKYTLFMLTSGVSLLFAFVILAFTHADGHIPSQLSFDYLQLLDITIPTDIQTTLFFLLLIGFGAKAALFPFHTWLPTVAMEGPASIAAIMTGLKLGLYGFIRFIVPLAPQASQTYHWLLAGLGVIGILFGAIVAMNQSNLRRMLAYSSISHAGLVLLGISAFNIQGIQGAIYQLLNFTLIAGGIYMLTGFIHHRTGSTDTISLGGIANTMPLLAGFYLLFGFAGMGIPGTNGFIAEYLILLSTLQTHAGAGLAALLGMVLSASYFMVIYRNAFLGRCTNPVIIDAIDLRPRELAIIFLFSTLILFTGFYPGGILEITKSASYAWLSRL
ncbi:MAG: NADH-quinone oxidoreductase subunit M [Gammaproteobacteria bacterium]|nr:NADH-quinone oxidoreductase subunit M [Gammaproteobacteria bacterium]MDH5734784.1 NADH-quinone oxidoreductase subunit M [Gammaproteobacteria bacterium]